MRPPRLALALGNEHNAPSRLQLPQSRLRLRLYTRAVRLAASSGGYVPFIFFPFPTAPAGGAGCRASCVPLHTTQRESRERVTGAGAVLILAHPPTRSARAGELLRCRRDTRVESGALPTRAHLMLTPKSSAKYAPTDAVLGATSDASYDGRVVQATRGASFSPSFPPAVDLRFVQPTPSACGDGRGEAGLTHCVPAIIALYTNPPRTRSTTPTGSRALAFLDDVLGALGLISVDTRVPDVCCYTPVDVRPGPASRCRAPPRGRGEEAVLARTVHVARARGWGRGDGAYLLLFPNEEYARERGGRPGAREDRGLGALLLEHAPRAALWAGGAQNSRTEARHETHGCNLHTAVAYLPR
ncbi:hypothetical protein FB451DRAFT_1465783 [Mycena latifolia]|nr:hypothetical protein FB451DRAFT_1465783 [Mycena latifolia]